MSTPEQRAARERFGGIKPGSSFLGFAAAYGVVTLITGLTALVAANAGVALAPTTGVNDLFAVPDASLRANTVVGIVVGLVAVLVAYYLGGYVAGRMARFDGARQGLAVWLWGLVVGLLVAVLSFALAGSLGSMVDVVGELPASLLVGVLVVLAVQLVGAVLGGLAGMRFHRRVDRLEADVSAGAPVRGTTDPRA